jgi:ferritin-like metal-binding protein YciE
MAELKTLHNMFGCARRDFYDAERQIIKALPTIINAVSDESLREALSEHLAETRGQVNRLEQASEWPGAKPSANTAPGWKGSSKKGATGGMKKEPRL